jgi:polysaccharide biosynthesis/export protein
MRNLPLFCRRRVARSGCDLLAVFLLLASAAAGQNQATRDANQADSARTSSAAATAGPATSVLRLGVGDLIEVSVYNVAELTTKTRIGGNGEVYLPLIDHVHVAGLNIEEAETLIQKRLSDGGFVKDPHVTVFVNEYASQGASILGEVAKPGIYPVLGEQRLFDLISAAGGLTDKAGRSVTLIHRSAPEKPISLALSRNLADNPESNVTISPGDTLIVGRAEIVYVVGDVGRPSGLLMESGHVTVLQAIALAGGTTRTANLGGARIIRKGPEGMTETRVPLKKILRAQAPDVPMQANDILFVPGSVGKTVFGHSLEAVVQAAATVGMVAVIP